MKAAYFLGLLVILACGQVGHRQGGAGGTEPSTGGVASGTAAGGTSSTPPTSASGGSKDAITVPGAAAGDAARGGDAALGGGGASSAGDAGSASGAGTPAGIELDPSWAHWPMPNPPSTGLPHPASYDTSRPGIVVDRVTGLTWQRDLPSGSFVWEEAKRYCGSLLLSGYDDWRLPSRIELSSLVDFTRAAPSIAPDAFPNTPPELFYSASFDQNFAPNAVRYVSFQLGDSNWLNADYPASVRCVRVEAFVSESGIPPARYDVGAETVIDLGTELMWERLLHTESENWMYRGPALARCENLTLSGYDDWRAPSINELLTLVDERHAFPAIDGSVFLNAIENAWRFWSSSALPDQEVSTIRYWALRLADGISQLEPDGPVLSICVRDVPPT